MRAILLCALLLVAGCRGTRVSLMGFEPGRPVEASDLSKDEKIGVVVVIGAVVALGVAGALAAD